MGDHPYYSCISSALSSIDRQHSSHQQEPCLRRRSCPFQSDKPSISQSIAAIRPTEELRIQLELHRQQPAIMQLLGRRTARASQDARSTMAPSSAATPPSPWASSYKVLSATAVLLAVLAIASPHAIKPATAASIQRRSSSVSHERSRRQQSTDVGSLSDDTINLVKQRCADAARGSWENGTRAQALLDYDYPMLSVFHDPTIPISPLAGIPTEVNAIAQYTIANKPSDTLMFCEDASAADPASLGVSILLANVTVEAVDYMAAVEQENSWLLTHAPRASDGAISHRVAEVQLWSDFVSMVPPYMAYYGALTGNEGWLQAAYDQCRMYRAYMTANGSGPWRHILLGSESSQDPGFWATGNAWAAYGMLRVLGTMMHTSSYSASDVMSSQKDDLKIWILEILNSSWNNLNRTNNLLPNYLEEPGTFSDAASTALMAAVSYRLAQLGIDKSTVGYANAARQAVFAGVDTTTGWLSPVVDPYDWSREGSNSAEGQAFVLMLSAAHRDYVETTGDNTSGGDPPSDGGNNGNTGAASGRNVMVDAARILVPVMLLLLAVASSTIV